MTRAVYEPAATRFRRPRAPTGRHADGLNDPRDGGQGGRLIRKRITKETHPVLTLTENASTVVKTIVDQSIEGAEAGLRISQDS